MRRGACRGATSCSSDARRAVTSGKSGAVCASLALAAHAALLIGAHDAARAPGGHAGAAVTARYVLEAPAPGATPEDPGEAPAVPEAPLEARADIGTPTPQTETARETAAPDSHPPAFDEDGQPRLGFPDAPMPAEGVQLRAYVELEPDGSLREVATAAPPGTAPPPPGFQKATERALRQARFTAGNGSAYCLLVRFEPDAPAPRLAWLPGAARDAARCLAGAMPAPRELANAAAP